VTALWTLAALAPAAPAAEDLASRPLSLVLVLAILGVLPFLFMTLTAFVKIATVLHIARSAIGVPEVPPNVVVLALSFALTLLAMAPLGARLGERLEPLLEPSPGESAASFVRDAAVAVREPLRGFLSANASARHLDRFHAAARNARQPGARDAVNRTDFSVIVPAFLVTELVEAFALGFAILLPFLVIDLVIASVLSALAMQGLAVAQISLPFKLLLFVSIDGWTLLAEALVTGYQLG